VRGTTVKRIAAECGFHLAGIAYPKALPDADAYLDWVSRGLAGRMSYLADGRALIRKDPRHLLPSLRSIISVGKLYDRAGPGTPISRYAQAPDYHYAMREQLQMLASRLQQEFGGFDYKLCVDTAPLLERSYARMAGLGWIGRNTCLINQELGSWFFLAEILTSLELEPDTPPADRCGSCTRCLDACPTAAIVPGGLRTELDATRCISYFTIELKGSIPESDRAALGTHVFGCDICQEVCPWNAKHAPPAGDAASLEELAALTPEEFRLRFRETPLWRSKYSGLLRNIAVAMGNSGDLRYLPTLERLAASDDPLIAEHACWALSELKER
jgi:epoxyqueuosine reductase